VLRVPPPGVGRGFPHPEQNRALRGLSSAQTGHGTMWGILGRPDADRVKDGVCWSGRVSGATHETLPETDHLDGTGIGERRPGCPQSLAGELRPLAGEPPGPPRILAVDAFSCLLTRRTATRLVEPGPTDSQLAVLLAA